MRLRLWVGPTRGPGLRCRRIERGRPRWCDDGVRGEGWARALEDCDPGDQCPTKGQRPDRPVGSRNLCSRRCGQAVEARNDEIKDLLRFDPMVGIDRLGIAPDQKEPEQVDWRSPSLDAALGEIVEQTLSVNGVLPRGKPIICAPGIAPLPHCPQVRSANGASYAPSEAPAAQDRQHCAGVWLSSRAALTGLDRADGD